MIQQTRRGLITGLISLMAAPAIVRAASLMPVKAIKPMARFLTLQEWNDRLERAGYWEKNALFDDLTFTEYRGIPLRFSTHLLTMDTD